MSLRATSGNTSIGRLNQTVNLTPYNYLKLNYPRPSGTTDSSGSAISQSFTIGISTNATVTPNSFTSSVSGDNSSAGVAILNISNITGNYYIYFYATCSSSGSTDYVCFNTIFLSNS